MKRNLRFQLLEPWFFLSLRHYIKADMKEAGDGVVGVEELTKRQRALVGGGCDLMGRKTKPPESEQSNKWAISWSEEDAPAAYADLMNGEPCIHLSPDGVYVATRFKRALCKGLSGPFKAVKDVEKAIEEMKPTLKSISFTSTDAPAPNGYNTFIAGSCSCAADLPPGIGHVGSTAPADVYDYFLKRRNGHLIAEAGKLISTMLTDVVGLRNWL